MALKYCVTGRVSFRLRPVRLDTRVGTYFVYITFQCFDLESQLLCVFPSRIFRIALSGAACGISGWFLIATIYPIIATVRATPTLC